MRQRNFRAYCVLAATIIAFLSGTAFAALIDDLAAGAKKEGVLELYAPSTLTPEGAQLLGQAFNKRHGLNLRVNFTPAGAMTRDVGKVVSIAAPGQPQG